MHADDKATSLEVAFLVYPYLRSRMEVGFFFSELEVAFNTGIKPSEYLSNT